MYPGRSQHHILDIDVGSEYAGTGDLARRRSALLGEDGECSRTARQWNRAGA
jgi:hypothetical protein